MFLVDQENFDVESDLGSDEILSVWRRTHGSHRHHRLRHIVHLLIHHNH